MISCYKAYSDDNHGWLRVSKLKLQSLGIMGKISTLSYEDEEYLYLEEDLDAGIFLSTQKDEDIDIDEHYCTESPIRKLNRYKGGLS